MHQLRVHSDLVDLGQFKAKVQHGGSQSNAAVVHGSIHLLHAFHTFKKKKKDMILNF